MNRPLSLYASSKNGLTSSNGHSGTGSRSIAYTSAILSLLLVLGSGCCPKVHLRADDPSTTSCPERLDAESGSASGAEAAGLATREFLSSARASDIDRARSLLSARLRERYSAEGLAADLEAAGESVESDLALIEAALEQGGLYVLEGGREALLPLGGGRSLRLVIETGGWRIDSLHWRGEIHRED